MLRGPYVMFSHLHELQFISHIYEDDPTPLIQGEIRRQKTNHFTPDDNMSIIALLKQIRSHVMMYTVSGVHCEMDSKDTGRQIVVAKETVTADELQATIVRLTSNDAIDWVEVEVGDGGMED